MDTHAATPALEGKPDLPGNPDSQGKPVPQGKPAPQGKPIFGQPRGLATLFLTEMWERFSFYGARAILILFMTATAGAGGLGLSDQTASSIYGLYLSGSYLCGVLGG